MSNWTADQQRARREKLKADGRCVRCGGGMLPEWAGYVHCPECREKRAAATRKYNHTERGRERDRRWKERKRQDPEWRRKDWDRTIAYKLYKKLNGLCRDCSDPSLDDSLYCLPCRDRARKRTRDWMRRYRAGKPQPTKKRRRAKVVRLTTRLIGKPYAHPEPKPETMSERVLRAASHFDEFTNEDIREATGLSSNRVSVELGRLKRRGTIVLIRGGHGSVETTYRVSREDRRAA